MHNNCPNLNYFINKLHITHKLQICLREAKKSAWSDRDNFLKSIYFNALAYSKFLLKTPVKVAVVALTVIVAGLAVWGITLLEQKFDPMWFLPPNR